MSDTMSFESIVNDAMEKVCSYYEMSKTESFESVIERVSAEIAEIEAEDRPFPYRLSANVLRNLRDRLCRAHDREIRDTAQQEYHRGYGDGAHSMDAEHRSIAMRLRGLRFDGGSHENLARIAYAIYPCATGWTCESAAGLRDKLVDLMGGISDDTSIGAGGGACAGCDGGNHREQAEVSYGGTADDSPADFRGRTSCDVVHLDGLVAYDVLDNERRKAIAELRKCDGGYTLEWDNIYEIFDALGVDYVGMTMAEVYENLRDRLIHLLGGDQPSGIDVLREMDAESDTDGTSPNDDPTSSITDELRKWASDRHCKGISHTDVLNIGLIADRIDAQFDRICQQQEAVLQSIIDEVVEERKSDRLRIEKLEKQRDEAREERDELQAKLDAIRNALDG